MQNSLGSGLTVFMLGLCLTQTSCRHAGSSRLQEFVKTPAGDEPAQTVDFKLKRVADIAQVTTRVQPGYDQKELEDDQFDPNSNDRAMWNISFGKITKDQFETLRSTYYSNPKLKYDSARAYELVDFMPPQIQALKGFQFKDETMASKTPFGANETDPNKKGFYTFYTFSNCWNAAFEVVHADPQKTSIYYVDGSIAAAAFTDEKYSEFVAKYPIPKDFKTAESIQFRNKDLKPFDIILIYATKRGSKAESLQHVAVYLDDDFYFEKTGPDSKLNYRFVKFDDIATTYLTQQGPRIEVRRFNKVKPPAARDIFSLKARGLSLENKVEPALFKEVPDLLNRVTSLVSYGGDNKEFTYIAEVPMSYDTSKDRYVLAPAAFQRATDVGEPVQDN